MRQELPLLFSDIDVLNLVDNTGYKITVKKGDMLFGINKLDIYTISTFDPSDDKLEVINGVVNDFGLNKYNSLFVDLVVKKNNLDHINTVTFSQDNSFIGKTYQEVLKEFLDQAIPFIKTFGNRLNEKIRDLKLIVKNKIKDNRLGNYDEDIWNKVKIGDQIYVLNIETCGSINEKVYQDSVYFGIIKNIIIENEINDLGFKDVIIDMIPMNSDISEFTLVALKSTSVIGYSIDDVFDGYYIKSLESLESLNKTLTCIKDQLNQLTVDLELYRIENKMNIAKEKNIANQKIEEDNINSMLLKAEKRIKTTPPSFKELDEFGNTTRYD